MSTGKPSRLWAWLVSNAVLNKVRRMWAVYQVVKDYSDGSVRVFWDEINICFIFNVNFNFFSE